MIIKKVTDEELKQILKTHTRLYKFNEIDEITGHKTIIYVVRRKTQEQKYEEVIKLKPFDQNNLVS
jgi:hypothetical protein